MLRVIVIPGDAVVIQEDEQFVLVLDAAFLILPCRLRLVRLRRQVVKEASRILFMLVQVVVCKAELVNRVNDRFQHGH